jgi:hypothetical protein
MSKGGGAQKGGRTVTSRYRANCLRRWWNSVDTAGLGGNIDPVIMRWLKLRRWVVAGTASQVIGVLRDVLLEHMNDPEALAEYRVQRAMYFDEYGNLFGDSLDGVAVGLMLTMLDGSELRLTLTDGFERLPRGG